MRIGFIGLGIMGRPMALNLIKAGFELKVYNRTGAKTKPLIDAGAVAAGSPRDAAQGSDVVITIVSDTPDVESVLFGRDGISDGDLKSKVVIDMSTIAPAATAAFASRLSELGAEMLDAPVTGGEKGAIEGTLGIMVGGRKAVFEKYLPVLQAMGKTIVYAGPNGSGQKTKLVNQIVGALNILAMTEGLRFARSSGLDLETTLKVVSSGAAGSWMLTNLGPRVLKDDFAPGFFIKLQQKDLRLCREAIQEFGERFEGTELTYRLFTEAIEKNLGDQGTQGLINLWPE